MEADVGNAGSRLDMAARRIAADDFPSGLLGQPQREAGHLRRRLGDRDRLEVGIGRAMDLAPVVHAAHADEIVVAQVNGLELWRIGEIGCDVMDGRGRPGSKGPADNEAHVDQRDKQCRKQLAAPRLRMATGGDQRG